jgi:hypothetical protein
MLLFAAVGSYLVFTGHAATTTSATQLQIAFNRGLCMDNWMSNTTDNNKVDLYACNDTMAQEWSFRSVSGGYLLVNGQGTCADDTGGGVSVGSNYAYLVSYTCSSTDHNQIWEWNGQQIQNAYNNGCINDPAASTTSGQRLIVYPCGPNQTNAEWYQVAPPPPSVSISTPASGATASGTVTVSANAGVSPGTITQLTVSAGGTTLASCSAAPCSASWNTKSFANGTYTIQATAVTSGGNSAAVSESVKVNNAAPATNPPPSQSGGSSAGSGSSSGSKSASSGSGSTSKSSLSVDSSPSDDTISSGSDTAGSGDNSDASDSQPPDDTSNGPAAFNIEATNVTSDTASLSWQASGADTYVVKYGTSSNNLASKLTTHSTSNNISVTLRNLPSHTQIYVSVTPSENGNTGPSVSTNFTTLKAASHLPVSAIGWAILLLLAAAGIWYFRRRVNSMGQSRSRTPAIDIDHLSLYPREDPATQEARVNWWATDDQRQAIAQHQNRPPEPTYDVPDMYAEGRKRLEDEEERRRSPGQ